jgi:uncharacterized circularly permuted ATP-grasp superfamily protein
VTAAATIAPYLPEPDVWDEALHADGRPRATSAAVLAALADHAPGELVAAVQARLTEEGVVFHSEDGDRGFVVDPVPRAIGAEEWSVLARGLSQRVRALNAFVADVYGPQSIFTEGVVPERLLESEGHEPFMCGVAAPGGIWAAIAGLDLVRDPGGRLLVLEDNLTTPSGSAYAAAARRAVGAHLDAPGPLDALPELLAGTLRAAAPEGVGDPATVVLTDGRDNPAHWEHAWLARALDVPLVEPGELSLAGDELRLGAACVDVVYRRTNADRLDDPVGALLAGPLRAGTLGVVNAYGAGVADDKLAHAYVAEMIRFYLGEEPRLGAVETLDLGRPEVLERVLDTLPELVVKPRAGHGGIGVVIGAQADRAELDAVRRKLREEPGGYVAQPLVPLSRHPTVVDGRLVPRHVDLRPFVFMHDPDDARVLRGGLTRVAFGEGVMVVNSTQNGGAKDTWVV